MNNDHDTTQHPRSPESKEAAAQHPSDPPIRVNHHMVGGILIPNAEGVRWYKDTYGVELSKDHRMDGSVRMQLERILTREYNLPFGVDYAPRRDFLATTQVEDGVWVHNNPKYVDDVLVPEHQMKGDSPREEEMREILRDLGFKLYPGEFKCFYSYSS
ncbi:hypothetical protein B0H15DRAFT_141737 [Mycena belliarum]|uniref:Uncharacterized protein n=1 Tax=Mycena belliarum TaxID=1033014 RepID=A0AAD6XKW5_9AGAR|nr:hypothetical protein B0H15DRAFT_141737 [Mycena belliae]